MSSERDSFVENKVERMSLQEKVGQLLTFTWRGAILTPSGIEQITKLHAGGLCLEPYGLETCKNLYWGNSQVDQDFQRPPDYFDIAFTYFDPHNHGVSVTPEELTEALNRPEEHGIWAGLSPTARLALRQRILIGNDPAKVVRDGLAMADRMRHRKG